MNKTAQVANVITEIQTAISVAEEAIEHHAKMKNSYFFTSPYYASERRAYERKHTMVLSFEFKGHQYEYISNCNCSCNYVYFSDGFYFDGKKTTVTRIKNVLKQMEETLGKLE